VRGSFLKPFKAQKNLLETGFVGQDYFTPTALYRELWGLKFTNISSHA